MLSASVVTPFRLIRWIRVDQFEPSSLELPEALTLREPELPEALTLPEAELPDALQRTALMHCPTLDDEA
jgi:hypothetical protein